MITHETLLAAERRGIISAGQLDQLIELADRPNGESNTDLGTGDESFRLVGGGNDVFVGLGIVLLLAGLWTAVTTFFPINGLTGYAVMGVLIWLLAEFITRQKRMKFSSLILAIAFFSCWAWLVGNWAFAQFDLQTIPENAFGLLERRADYRLAGWSSTAGLAFMATVYFLRFRVPVMAALLAICVIAAVGLITADIQLSRVLAYDIQVGDKEQLNTALQSMLYIPLLCGLLIFVAGVALDIYDRLRETVWSDCAFWLHVISAPLIVHPLFVLATGQNLVFDQIEPGSSPTLIILVLIAVFFYVALAIDRRSLLVPSLGYFGTVGIYSLVSMTSENTGIPTIAVILGIVGLLIIIFGIGWQRIRGLVIGTTLPHVLLQKLPTVTS